MTEKAQFNDPGWSVIVRRDDIPEEGRHLEIEADAPARAAVARRAGVLGLERLQAAFDLRRHGISGARATGRVTATVRQTCSVSLEPMDSALSEAIDVTFLPADAMPAGADLSVEDSDLEPLVDGRIDLGAVAVEFLILGIDPYPRKEGAQFAGPAADADRSSPFDVLAALKK